MNTTPGLKKMDAIQKLKQEYEEKLSTLERNIALAAHLPTHGQTFTWLGDGGYQGNEKQPDTFKTAPLEPWIFHAPFRGAQHVAYRAPDEYPDYSPLAKSMHVAYIRTLCQIFDPYLIDILALKGRYASYVHSWFDWKSHRDYSDSKVLGQGRVRITADASVEHGYNRLRLDFYVNLPEVGIVQVSVDLPSSGKLQPRPVGVSRYDNHGPASSVDRWDIPPNSAVNVWRRNGDRRLSFTAEYLFDSIETALEEAGVS